MTEFKQDDRCYLAVEVPEEAKRFNLEYNDLICYTDTGFEVIEVLPRCLTEQQQLESLEVTGIIIGIASELTEEQALNIEGELNCEIPYQPYYRPYGMSEEEYIHEVRIAENKLEQWYEENSAINRLKSRLTSLKLSDNVLIIQKL